jgi:hypothetical protein
MDEIYWKILDAIASISKGSGIGIWPEQVISTIGIQDREYLDRIMILQKMGFLDLSSGGVAVLMPEGRLALQDRKVSERKQEQGRKASGTSVW